MKPKRVSRKPMVCPICATTFRRRTLEQPTCGDRNCRAILSRNQKRWKQLLKTGHYPCSKPPHEPTKHDITLATWRLQDAWSETTERLRRGEIEEPLEFPRQHHVSTGGHGERFDGE